MVAANDPVNEPALKILKTVFVRSRRSEGTIRKAQLGQRFAESEMKVADHVISGGGWRIIRGEGRRDTASNDQEQRLGFHGQSLCGSKCVKCA